jgi:hypothetical protein
METHTRSDGSESSIWDAAEERKLNNACSRTYPLLFLAPKMLKTNSKLKIYIHNPQWKEDVTLQFLSSYLFQHPINKFNPVMPPSASIINGKKGAYLQIQCYKT